MYQLHMFSQLQITFVDRKRAANFFDTTSWTQANFFGDSDMNWLC